MPKRKPKAARRDARHAKLAVLIRQAAKSGAAEAIEHCGNFWSVSDGYKKYIEQQIAEHAEGLMAAVRAAVRAELALLPETLPETLPEIGRRRHRKR